MALIFFFSSRDAPEILKHKVFDLQDKALHATAYFVLAVLFLRGFLWQGQPCSTRFIVMAAALSALYGATDEWHQRYVPTRTSDFSDWLADSVGATLLYPLQGWASRLLAWERARRCGFRPILK